MQVINQKWRGYVGNRAFYSTALQVMIPIAIQQLINNLFNMVDNIMVGSLDTSGLAIAAVNVANKPYLIFFGLVFGVTGGAGLLISQYYGNNQRQTCQRLFSLQIWIVLLFSTIFFILLRFFPRNIMTLFVDNEQTIEMGIAYMDILAYTFLPAGISSTVMFSMRALGINRISMIVSMATMGINVFFNYALIFGKLGFPEMGIVGAALGTLIARVCEMTFYIFILFSKKTVFSFDFFAFLALPKQIFKDFFSKCIPLVINEIFWTTGLNLYFWSYSHINESALPAITIADICYQISAILAIGMSSAVSVMLGTALGANRLKEVKESTKKLFGLTLCIGVCSLVFCIAIGYILPLFFDISPELKQLATKMAIISGLFAPFSHVYSFCFCCLRAGGDTKNALLLDSGYMWFVPVPVSVCVAIFFGKHIDIITAFIIVQVLMNAKVFFAVHIVKQKKWIRNITINGEKST